MEILKQQLKHELPKCLEPSEKVLDIYLHWPSTTPRYQNYYFYLFLKKCGSSRYLSSSNFSTTLDELSSINWLKANLVDAIFLLVNPIKCLHSESQYQTTTNLKRSPLVGLRMTDHILIIETSKNISDTIDFQLCGGKFSGNFSKPRIINE